MQGSVGSPHSVERSFGLSFFPLFLEAAPILPAHRISLSRNHKFHGQTLLSQTPTRRWGFNLGRNSDEFFLGFSASVFILKCSAFVQGYVRSLVPTYTPFEKIEYRKSDIRCCPLTT